MRRLFGVLLLCSSLSLVAAAPPALPTTTPTPLPLITPTPVPTSRAGAPTVLVFPFDVQGGSNPNIGMAMAQITVQQLQAAGGLTVLPVPQNVARAEFLSTARADHADYYLSGYVTPVGDMASSVEQLVAIDSGVIIYSQTAEITSVADVASQALVVRDAIMAHSGLVPRENVAASSSTPAPASSNGTAVKITGLSSIVDSVFGKHAKTGPRASASPIVKPDRGVIIARVTGSASIPASEVTTARSLLYLGMNHFFNTEMTAVTTNPERSADSICGTSRDNTIASGVVSTTPPAKHEKEQTVFTLTIYTCFGAQLAQQIGKGPNISAAIASAIAAYAAAHPDNS
ncbi:MAG TPA: hypothetical protein VMH02_04520 [Verrucomicrobiae bacterium]|nr:hypothetical protein [Verrucomicrobiae bacterium]